MLYEVGSLKVINTEKLVSSELSMRCVTRLGSDIFYFDNDYPSIHFAELITTEVREKIMYVPASKTVKLNE